MEATDSRLSVHWTRFLIVPVAILPAMLAMVAEIWRPEFGPVVSLYILSALLGLGLQERQYHWFVAVIALAMISPIFFEGPAAPSGLSVGELLQRLSGLTCLGILAFVSSRVASLSRTGLATPFMVEREEREQWVHHLVAPHPTSDVLGPLGQLSKTCLMEDPSDDGQPITSSLTRIRPLENSGNPLDQHDHELSFDGHDFKNETDRIVEKLRVSGCFDDHQLKVIEAELGCSIRHNLSVDAGVSLEQGLRVGRFIVDAPLGRGGEGNVYRGHDQSGEPAAIKILHNMRVSDRFRREMHLARQLAHPNIVTAYEVGEFRGLPFITMELLKGPDLHVLVRDSGPLAWQVSAQYMLQAARALAHAHERDLIHRDIKPGNMILNGHGAIKLVDFGLASMGGQDAGIDSVFQFETKEGHLAGTLPYMSPEQARSLSDATVQSDIYGVGATWFYLLTGRERLRGKTFSRQFENLLLRRRFNALPEHLLPEALRQVYRRMVAYDIRDRYADCRQLVSDLENALIAAGESVDAVVGINVLVVEDSRTDMVLAIEMLRRSNSTLSIHEARTLSDGLQICQRMQIDLVFLDLTLPDSSGVETVMRFRKAVQKVPLVVLTGMTHDEVGSQCLTAGASTFVSKAGLTPHRMERTIFVALSRFGLSQKPPSEETGS